MRKNKEVIKHSACISISGEVGLMARRIFNIFLSHAYDDLPDTGLFHVNATNVFKALKINSHNWDALKDALKELRTQDVEYDQLGKDGSGEWFSSSLLAVARIKDGLVTFEFSSIMRELLYDPAVYARINLLVQNRFKSKHSLTLYELCMDYKNVRSTGTITLKKLRNIFGVEKSYKQFFELNRSVFQPALKEINAPKNKTGITVTMEKIKHGRSVIGVKFLIKTAAKIKKEKEAIDAPVKKTPEQLRYEKKSRKDERQEANIESGQNWYQELSEKKQNSLWTEFDNQEKGKLEGFGFLKDCYLSDGHLNPQNATVAAYFRGFVAKKQPK